MTDVKSNQKYDLLLLGMFSLLVYYLGAKFDLQENFDSFCDLYERFEVDELMLVALALVPASVIYFWRRWQEIRQANRRLAAALKEIEHLRGILPICCSCKKIRDDDGYWHEVEAYFETHLDSSFTHGICNDCIAKLYPELHQKMMAEKQTWENGLEPDNTGGSS